ncbi:MAG: aspartate aminotransferase family protein [Desulfobacterales bacterium]|nr:aspartate aminotransferase family protein [Desulfobacterales bacterium]
MESGPKTREMFLRAKKAIPLGVNSNFRYWGDDFTLVVKNAQGGYLYDQDDKKYVDYRLGFGPVILGHNDPDVHERVIEAMQIGNAYAMTHPYEIECAEKIKAMTGVDLVRFANSGTEATMHAIRMARAYTGRDIVLKFEGCYHGFHDYTLWNCQPPIPGCGYRRNPVNVPQCSGIPSRISDLCISIPYNDEEILERKVKDNFGNIACIIVEPLMGNMASTMPKKGYLEFIRKICDEYGIVMIMDEVKTGFRIAKGGAQEYFGVKGDLVTYAKSMANGFPLAAIAGPTKIMGEIAYQQISHGGTYCGNVVATSAACATIDAIEAGALDKVNAHGKKLADGFKKILAEQSVPAIVQGPDSMPGIVFTDKDEVLEFRDWAEGDHGMYEEIISEMRQRGVMPDADSREPFFTCAAHTDEDADFTLNVFEDSLKAVLGK